MDVHGGWMVVMTQVGGRQAAKPCLAPAHPTLAPGSTQRAPTQPAAAQHMPPACALHTRPPHTCSR
eukprot:337038-Chlamydomonas_euryale.AAC.1